MKLDVDPGRAVVTVVDDDGRLWFKLRLLMSLDTLDGPDETLGVRVEQRGNRIVADCISSRWRGRRTVMDIHPDRLELTGHVEGTGRLTTAHLLGGWRPPYGFLPSGSALSTVLSPNPDHPRRIIRPAVEPAVIGVVGDGGQPGVGRWLFTPAPWCYAVARDPAGEWASLGLAVPIEDQTFTSFHYSGGTDGFSLRLDYEGHTHVDGAFSTPTLVIAFGQPDPYAAFQTKSHPKQVRKEWLQPMFCGWGAQNHLALTTGTRPQDQARQSNYDNWLAGLAAHGVVPGTVVVDDKWQQQYASCRPDPAKWPDLRGWIARRHEQGQRVLLWWKAWDTEGAPPSACVRLPDGTPVALDPDTDDCRMVVEDAITYALGTLGADGLKIDFTARTPSGTALDHAGRRWGAALLHELLRTVYSAAKTVKPDSLVITHTPNAAFAGVTDMIRLNDIRMLDAPDPDGPVVEQMAYRAAVVAAACPGTPIDTDGWCLPDRASWAQYLAVQPRLGVPALYYATHIDHSGEPLRAGDLAAVAEAWQRYRRDNGLETPGGYNPRRE